MADICKCCGKKISGLMGSFQLSDEYSEQICSQCLNQLEPQLSRLRIQTDSEGFYEVKEELSEIVDHSDFTDEGKEYVYSYINSLSKRFPDYPQQQKKRQSREELRKNQKITTGYNFEGYRILSYNGVLSGSVVLGTGFLSEFTASFSDFFGRESNSFSNKIESAREGALSKLKDESARVGGNALIGVDFDYITFAGNMIGVVASGTSVLIEEEQLS